MDDFIRFLEKKYANHLEESGGIFEETTRRKLIHSINDQRLNKNFWYDVRNAVASALLDLELFLDVADEAQVRHVITASKLQAVVNGILGLFHGQPLAHRPSYLLPELPPPKKGEATRFTEKRRQKLLVDAKYRRAKLAEQFTLSTYEFFTDTDMIRRDLEGTSPSLKILGDASGLIQDFVHLIRQHHPNSERLSKLD